MGNGHCLVDRKGITRALGKRQGMAGRVNLYHRIWAAPLLGKKGGMDGQSSRVLEERSSWSRGHHKPGQQGPAWPRHCEHSREAFHHQTLFLSRMLECSCETTGRIQGYCAQDTSGIGLDNITPVAATHPWHTLTPCSHRTTRGWLLVSPYFQGLETEAHGGSTMGPGP